MEAAEETEEDYGLIRPSLIKTLKSILDQYPDDGQILKEIIQNAEDAGASVVKFLFDEREYPAKKLHHPDMARFQGPALYAYNDALFEDEDWRGIRMLQDSVKVKDNMKVGRFGLGFKSVLHMTDLPSVLSGELLQMIDPHEAYFSYHGEKSTGYRWNLRDKRDEMSQISDQFKPFQDVFDCSADNFRRGYFPGTIFRFPLRKDETLLSDILYTRSKIKELFDSFIPNAETILLFLKNVQRIELLVREKDDTEAKLCFSVSVKQECLDKVRGRRAEFLSQIAKNKTQDASANYRIAVETISYDNCVEHGRQTFQFLVNEYYAGSECSKAGKETEINFVPLVGTALPLKEPSSDQIDEDDNAVGQLFCFLPLPVEQKSSTGLPVHVNGFFAISQNRRHLKWPTKGHSYKSDKELVWNQFLLNKILPLSYVELVKTAVKLSKAQPNMMAPKDVCIALPNMDLVDAKWNCVMQPFYEDAFRLEMFYTHSKGGQWLKFRDCVFDLLQEPKSMVDAVRNYLLSVDVPICRPPRFVVLALEHFTGLPPKKIDPLFVCQQLKQNKGYKQLPTSAKLALLSYVIDINDFEQLRGLKLLPVADGSFVQFKKPGDNNVYICTETCHRKLLPGREGQLLANVEDETLMKRLKKVMTSGKCNLVELDAEKTLALITDIIPSDWIGTPMVTMNNDSHPLSYEWLQDVWGFLRIHYPDLQAANSLPLLPVDILVQDDASEKGNTVEVVLAPLMLPSNLISLSALGTELPLSAAELLNEIQGVYVVRSLPDFVTAHGAVLGNYVRLALASDVLEILQEADKTFSLGHSSSGSKSLRNVLKETSSENIDALVKILLQVFEQDVSQQNQRFMRSLPLFASTNAEGNRVSVEEVGKACPENDFPVELDEPYLILSTAEQRRLAKKLQVKFISATTLLCHTILPKIRQRFTTEEETQSIMSKVFDEIHTYSKEDPELFARLADIPFVATESGHLMQPNELFDPENQQIRDIFVQQNVFPHGDYARSEKLILLRKMRLKGEKDVSAKDVLYAAARTEELIAEDIGSAKQKAKALLEFVVSHQNMLQEHVNGQTLSEWLSTIQWMPVATERHSFFPQTLPWAGEMTYVGKPAEICAVQLAFLGSCRLICSKAIPEQVCGALGLNTHPKLDPLVSQLKHIVKNYQVDEKAKYMDLLSRVYSGMAQDCSATDLCDAISEYELTEWIWNGDGFCTAESVFLNVPLDTRPYAYPLPSEMYRFREMFEQCGVSRTTDVGSFLKVLERIRDIHSQEVSHRETEGSSASYDAVDAQDVELEVEGHGQAPDIEAHDLQLAVDIINILSERVAEITEDQRQGILLPINPIKDGESTLLFKRLDEVTYCDVEWLQTGYSTLQFDAEDDALFYIHELVPLATANTLRVPTLISRMLNASELDITGFGQSEPLTDRLKHLVDDYADGLSIPKELIQNADDAGATEVAFLYDQRSLDDKQKFLIDEGMQACQGPALWVHNNAVFTNADFDAVIKLGGATKEKQLNKIGKFGLGFNSVYNVTDVPSFVSRNNLVIFDPNMNHLGRVIRGHNKPGIKIDIRENKTLLRKIPHQFSPYENIFNCRINHGEAYQGTLFRLPLRTQAQAARSKISSRAYSHQEVLELFKVAVHNCHHLLMFTQNVTTVRFCHLDSDDTTEIKPLFEISKKPVRIIRELNFVEGTPQHVKQLSGIDTEKRKLIENSNFLAAASQYVAACAAHNDKKSAAVPPPPRCTLAIRTTFQMHPGALSLLSGFSFKNIVENKYWLLASCLSTGASWQFSKEHGDRYLPIGGVAMELGPVHGVADDGEPQRIVGFEPRTDLRGKVFCHLPLPVLSDLPVHVNGAFAIAHSRRFLVTTNQDDKDQTNARWNMVVFDDAVAQAYLQILADLTAVVPPIVDKSIDFFRVWPKQASQHQEPYKSLSLGFYRLLGNSPDCTLSVRHDIVCQLKSSCFMDGSRRQFGCETTKAATVLAFESCLVNTNLVELTIQNFIALEEAGCTQLLSEKTFTLLRFCKEVFFPNIDQIEQTLRETILVHVLAKIGDDKDLVELLDILKCTACIPVGPDGSVLRRPSELVTPNQLVARMYDVEDHRFPISALKPHYKILGDLGMVNNVTSWENLEERTSSVIAKFGVDVNASQERLKNVLTVLEFKINKCLPFTGRGVKTIVEKPMTEKEREMREVWAPRFRNIKFLPTMKKPSDFPIEWFSDSPEPSKEENVDEVTVASDNSENVSPSAASNEDSSPEIQGIKMEYSAVVQSSSVKKELKNVADQPAWSPQLLSANESFPPEKCYLVSSTQYILDTSVMKPSVVTFLSLDTKQATLDQVLHQAKLACNLDVNRLNENSRKTLYKMMTEIYVYLQEVCVDNKQAAAYTRNALASLPCIFVDDSFVEPEYVALHFGYESQCAPYLYGMNKEWKRSFKDIFQVLGVKSNFSVLDYIQALKTIQMHYGERPLDERHIKVCGIIAGCLRDVMIFKKMKFSDCEVIWLPDDKCVLHPSTNLCVNDSRSRSGSTNMTFVHRGLPYDAALTLGVKPERVMKLKNHTQALPFGQRESLVTSIRRVIDEYPHQEIFKELIQNADDAGATDIYFVLDPRHHATKHIFDESWAPLQGPALLVYNNAPFTAADLASIQRLGEGNKRHDAFKAGQYGVGFTAIYHITDAPCLLTTTPEHGTVCAVFDPMCIYAPGATEASPGLLYTDVEDIWETYRDSFDCFLSDNLDFQKGTTFRFPMRNDKMAVTSKISSKAVNEEKIREMLNKLSEQLFDILLFTKTLRKARICIINTMTNKMDHMYTAMSKSQDESVLRELTGILKEESIRLQDARVDLRTIPVKDKVYRLQLVDSTKQVEDWCVSYRIGLHTEVEIPSTVAEALQKGEFSALPCGSTAVCLSRRHNGEMVTKPREFRLFCCLPLPQTTNLPVHVNGHFVLSSEARKVLYLNENETGYKQDWNEMLMREVVAPSYVNLLNAIRFEYLEKVQHNGVGEDAILLVGYETLESLLRTYQSYFPTLKQVQNHKLLETLFRSVYQHMACRDYCILPSVQDCKEASELKQRSEKKQKQDIEQQYSVKWFPPCGKGSGKAFFCKNDSFPQATYQTPRPSVINRITSFLTRTKANDKQKPTEAEVLKQLLHESGLNILCVSEELIECFENAEIKVDVVSPEGVLKFYQTFGTKDQWCAVGPVPCAVGKSVFKNTETLLTLLKYCRNTGQTSDEQFLTLLCGAPLLLTAERNLMQFDSCNPVFCTDFAHLLPSCADEFLHSSIKGDVFNKTDISSAKFLKKFGIVDLCDRLPRQVDVNTFFQQTTCLDNVIIPWDVKVLSEVWVERLWRFVKKELEGTIGASPNNASAAQNNVIATALECMKGWALIPVKVDYMPCLTRLENAGNVLHVSYLDFPEVEDALIKLKQPKLHVVLGSPPVTSDVIVLEPLVAHVSRPISILYFLANVQESAFTHLSDIEKDTLLRYLVACLPNLTGDANAKEFFAKLPFYKTAYDDVIKISECGVYTVPGDIPKRGLDSWQSREGIVFLKQDPQLNRLHDFLGCKSLSCVEVYRDFIFQHFELFDAADRAVHIRHVYENYVLNSANKLSSTEQEAFKDIIKDLPFIEDETGCLQPPSAFYDPENEVFKVMKDECDFPPKTPDDFEKTGWYGMLRQLGMIQEVTIEMFEEFVGTLEKNPTMNKIEKKSKVLVEHLFAMEKDKQQTVIPNIYQRQFIVPHQVAPHFQELVPIHSSAEHGKLIAFQDSIQENYAVIAWSSACILPAWADPSKIYGMSNVDQDTLVGLLGICPKPTPEMVTRHLQNICTFVDPRDQERKIFHKCFRWVFEYFKNLSDGWVAQYPEVQKRLSDLPCIPVGKGNNARLVRACQTVFNLAEDEEIPSYLYRLPHRLGEFEDFFLKIGGTGVATAEQYTAVLNELQGITVDRPLHPNQLRQACKAIRGLFSALQKEDKLKSNTKLYLVSHTHELINVQNLVHNDSPAYYDRIPDSKLLFLLRLRDCGVYSSTGDDLFALLPTNCQPQLLSDLVHECVVPGLTPFRQGLAEELESRVKSEEFRHSAIRLARHNALQSGRELSEIELMRHIEKLETVEFRSVQHLKTHLIYRGKTLPDSDCEKVCFVQRCADTKENGETKESITIYIKNDAVANTELFIPLAEVFNGLLPGLLRESVLHLLALLSCSRGQMKQTLDRFNIREDNSEVKSVQSEHAQQTRLFPTLGEPVTQVHGRSLVQFDANANVTVNDGDLAGYQETPESPVVYCRIESMNSPIKVFVNENEHSVQVQSSQLFLFN